MKDSGRDGTPERARNTAAQAGAPAKLRGAAQGRDPSRQGDGAGVAARCTGQRRRDELVRAAATEFARTGLRGTSTAVIAARAGISQPYVFRFFPSKKRLFIAACEQGMRHVLERLRRAAAGRSGTEALDSMAVAYAELRSRTPWPLLHLQLIAAWSDPELRGIASRMTLQLTECVEALSDVADGELWDFTARILFADPLRSLFPSDQDTSS